MSRSDALSLTLPIGSRSRARRRQRKRPPNWKRLVFLLLWDTALAAVNIVAASQGYIVNGVAAVMFVAGIIIDLRRLQREDGRPRPQDNPLVLLGGLAYAICLVAFFVKVTA